jgi:16S rRNA (guanine966-N2)-methyltransferase
MRIVAGEWRGRKLTAPGGDTTRPTADRTRETLFSMLVSRLGDFDDLKVGDFFAGSGALGLEALSRRGHGLLVEQDAKAVDAIRANIRALDAARTTVRASSVMTLGPAKEPLDLIFLDPPYHTGAGAVAIDKLGGSAGSVRRRGSALKRLPMRKRTRGFTVDADRKVGGSPCCASE